ncbi:hypothetical protein [Iningainema tapete]|uniref:SCO6045-like C-terminal domain-containing protein n=1 Tax=Iningainema tapete BLCC-T55 TaxID=2748662 RepID=A0A8J6XGA4_9CYAN|nr:hypothetical protein [Iningainema tapete]MBD2775314.1 hypothetical protein [Iningainema tapete BLCC-T55]
MGLVQSQFVLAQLYTNTEFRERFFANPQLVCTELGLTCDEVQQLSQLSQNQVNLFANSLKWKRLGEIRELLPRTAQALGKNFTALFWRYAETYLPQGIKKHREDAIAFANFIQKVALSEGITPHLLDLVRYEKAWLKAHEQTNFLTVCWLRYAVDEVLVRRAIAIWFRLSPRGKLHHITIYCRDAKFRVSTIFTCIVNVK